MFFDLLFFGPWGLLFILPGLLLGIYAQGKVKSAFAKYSKVNSRIGITADLAAEELMRKEGINNVTVTHVNGKLTDNYNPKTECVSLSDSVYGSTSIAAIGVAAHEIGHVIQKHKGYGPMKLRSFAVPIVNIGTRLAIPLVIIGILIEYLAGTSTSTSTASLLINIGVILYAFSTVFCLITLPVEFNASHRAKKRLVANGILEKDEIKGVNAVLDACALTYVAAFVTSLLYFLRFLFIISRFRRN